VSSFRFKKQKINDVMAFPEHFHIGGRTTININETETKSNANNVSLSLGNDSNDGMVCGRLK
jgi:hypothetical protein